MFQFNGRGELKYLLFVCGLFLIVPSAVYTQDIESQEMDRSGEEDMLFAEGEDPEFSMESNGTVFGLGDMIRMILVLAGVIGTIYGVFYLLKRASSGRYAQSSFIRVVGTQQLPGSRSLHLVEVGEQVFLVGSGENSISLISEITSQETLDGIRLAASDQAPAGRKSFSELLSGMFQPAAEDSADGTGTREPRERTIGPLDFLSSQKERLKRLR